jgi:hypothetical protein
MLHALEKAQLTPEQIDQAKAWTCVAHILSECGPGRYIDTSEGFILTTDDRMYWDGVYANLGALNDEQSQSGKTTFGLGGRQ